MNLARIPMVVSVAVLLASGAWPALPALATNSDAAPAPAAVSCAAAGRRVESLRAGPAPADAVGRAILWSEAVPSEARALMELVDVEGDCATSIGSFAAGLAALRTGEAFAINEDRTIAPRGAASAFLIPPDIEVGALAGLPQARFVAASRVAYRRDEGVLRSDYIGLWKGEGAWVVAAFSERKDGSWGPARTLLTSREPILGIAYFPAPDTPSGRIGLVQLTGPRTVRLIGYDWDHRSFFPAT